MAWVIGILKFIFAAIAVFFTCAMVLSCIQSVINPKIITKEGKTVEEGDDARGAFAIIIAVAWALVIALP